MQVSYLKSILWFVLFLSIGFLVSCGDDETTMNNDLPVASFQLDVSATNFLEVTFSNFSQNATSYSWDFGDGNTSTEESPTHTYASAGDYTVELTAKNANGSHSFSRDVMITDPSTAIKALTGDVSKVWKLSRNVDEMEYPLEVGPTDKSQIWWAFGLNEHIGSRPCIMEEEYIFATDGTYTYDSKGSVYADLGVWNANVEGQCVDETDPTNMTNVNGDDISAWSSGTFTFDFDPIAGTLTVNGLGAHVGLAKVGTTSEVNVPQSAVTYNVISIETDGPVDKLILETTITDGYWRFFLVSYDNPNDEPPLPGAPPTVSFTHDINGNEVTFTNTSIDADSYNWDFGDGNTSTDEHPVHTYANDGNYTVKLTAMNANGSNEATASVIISTMSMFSIDALNGGGSKTWKLNPEAGALAVGPTKGSSDWWANTLDDVTTRACTFDDTYTFDNAGNFSYNTNGDVWAEAYMGVMPDGCVAESDLPADAAAWGSGMHIFSVQEAMGMDPAYITVTGTGAFIALPKAFNGGEYAAPPPTPNGSVQYEVMSYINDGTNELLVITIDISAGQTGGAYWTFTLKAD